MQICDHVSNRSRIPPKSPPSGDEAGVGQPVLAGRDLGAVQVVNVDHAQVDPADGRCVVVDQADATQSVPGLPIGDLLVQLAAQGHLVGVQGRAAVGVGLVDVPAHADRLLAVQAGLPLGLPPRVAEDEVAGAEDDIRDDLLERRIDLGLRRGP